MLNHRSTSQPFHSFRWSLGLLGLAASLCSSPARAGFRVPPSSRHALLIANADYAGSTADLRLPIVDLRALADALSAQCFEVSSYENLTGLEMMGAATEFAESLPSNAQVVFFFSGHGGTSDGRDFMFGTDFTETSSVSPSSRRKRGVPLDVVEAVLERANPNFRVTILDIPRDRMPAVRLFGATPPVDLRSSFVRAFATVEGLPALAACGFARFTPELRHHGA